MVVGPRVVAAAVPKMAVAAVGAQALVFLVEIGQARKLAYRLVTIVAMRPPETRVVE